MALPWTRTETSTSRIAEDRPIRRILSEIQRTHLLRLIEASHTKEMIELQRVDWMRAAHK